MTLLEVALSSIQRGWFVFPCKPKAKTPATPHGFKDASNEESQIRAWWAKQPDANVGIATGASGLTVLDIDSGIADRDELTAFCKANDIAPTYTVRTGRRPEYGAQLYFEGQGVKSIAWSDAARSGDVRGATGYVMAAGSIHPSGHEYTVEDKALVSFLPNYVRSLKAASITGPTGSTNEAVSDDGGPIAAHRNVHMVSLLGRKRSEGADDDTIEIYANEINESRMVPPLGEDEVSRIVANICKYAVPEVLPKIILGGKLLGEADPVAEPVDWRTRYMTEYGFLNVKPPEFLIDGFLVKGSVAMLAGPVAQRKSIIALNIAHALCTREPLFGYFNVSGGHERVVYLCPEMGSASIVKRIKSIGLSQYIGKTLFIQTMSEEQTALDDLHDELPGAVVLVDTITRYVEGNENDSQDMRMFAKKVFRLMSAGATVILLHHSKKGSSGSLDDGLRGSSELAAFVDSCWVTDLEDTKKPYESLSRMRNVKQARF